MIGGGSQLGLVEAIGLAIVAFLRLRQPALIAFIAAGLLLGLFAEPFAGSAPAEAAAAYVLAIREALAAPGE